MDAFVAKLAHHATSYAIRSCLALTSTYLLQQGSKLIKTVDDDPLKTELITLQRRLARKIELISPILESIEFRYNRGNVALEGVIKTAQELKEEIDALARRFEAAALLGSLPEDESERQSLKAVTHAELLAIRINAKELIVTIDDAIPLINLWVATFGGFQQGQGQQAASAFSPSRLLQASYLVNVGDTQYILDPSKPMQIGPDFTLSLYMLFRGHASHDDGEPYGIEEGQRKPVWQEVMHKARVRLYRVPQNDNYASMDPFKIQSSPLAAYSYQLQIVEDFDDGRVHTLEDDNTGPTSYDGVALAGIRELIPVGQISKIFYADVGRILNINNEDGASRNPVLLIKRAVPSEAPPETLFESCNVAQEDESRLLQDMDAKSVVSKSTLPEEDPQDIIDRQLREESQQPESPRHSLTRSQPLTTRPNSNNQSSLPQNLDPEWVALEVFDIDDTDSSSSEDEQPTPEEEEIPRSHRPHITPHTSTDNNLIMQLHRMSLATNSPSRPSSRDSFPEQNSSSTLSTSHPSQLRPTSESLIERSPFGAIKSSLSLLEMTLRLVTLQEFEQTTHLAIPDHVLKFYLDDSASESGLQGRERWVAREEASRKVGFDPYTDAPGGSP